MTDLTDLIARVEAAECGGRDLDADIWDQFTDTHPVPGDSHFIPHYTTNLQDALSLVPDGWRVTHAYWDRKRAHFTLGNENRDVGWRDGDAATPAIALVLASLRAREGR